jgi:two-component system heavy metal sensor histidine kinase CusS
MTGAATPHARRLADLRGLGLARLARVRLGATVAMLGVITAMNALEVAPAWRTYPPPLVLYVGLAALLVVVARRFPRAGESALAWSVPCLDVVAVWVLQSRAMPLSTAPEGVAGWSLGPLVGFVALSSLSLRRRVVIATAVAAAVAEALLQRQADVSWAAVAASVVVLAVAAAATIWVGQRIDVAVARAVEEEAARRVATEHSAQVEQARAELARAHDALIAAQSEAEALTSLLVHDLKGPLTVVMGTLTLHRLRAEAQPGREPDADELRRAEESAQRLLRMISDLLSISRLEAGALRPRAETFDVSRLLSESAEAFRAAAESRGAHIRIRVTPGLGGFGDVELLRRVLDNLVANALGYLGGTRCIELSATSDGADWRLAVANEGPAVPPERRATLFQRFSTSRDGGAHAGLGLYLCRLVAEAHGGSIAMEEAEAGPSFVLRLPLPPRTVGEEVVA